MQIYPRYTPDELSSKGMLGQLPRHIGIIMDGNGRWAKQKLMPRAFGHRAGMEALHEIVRETHRLGIEALTVYAFSTENWRRPEQERSALFSLLVEFFDREIDELDANGVRVMIAGDCDGLPKSVQAVMKNAVERTSRNTGLCFCIAMNYGGRAEITRAVRSMIAEGILSHDVTEDVISAHLYTAGLPELDLVIRTANEMRLSNFLLWQCAYAEFVFTPTLWPAFTPECYFDCIREFMGRTRRFGKVVE